MPSLLLSSTGHTEQPWYTREELTGVHPRKGLTQYDTHWLLVYGSDTVVMKDTNLGPRMT